MNSLVPIITVIGFAITAAGLIGVSFRVGRNAQTVGNYREAANAWESKARSQSDEITELQEKLTSAEMTIETMKARLQLLEDLVTGRTAIEGLAAEMKDLFGELQKRMEALAEQIRHDVMSRDSR